MNVSDGARPGLKLRERRSIVIRREDHIGGPLGIVFLEPPDGRDDEIITRLRDYLGAKVKIIKAQVSRDQIEVEVESRGWPEEAGKLVALARDLEAKGVRRNTAARYRDALDMDPLNADALAGLGFALGERGSLLEALTALQRARELGADNVAVLLAIGKYSARLGRSVPAIAAYDRVLQLEPRNFNARRALRAMGRESTPGPNSPGASARTIRKQPPPPPSKT
jgi:tetratricopeptide (TPR) repeat protein